MWKTCATPDDTPKGTKWLRGTVRGMPSRGNKKPPVFIGGFPWAIQDLNLFRVSLRLSEKPIKIREFRNLDLDAHGHSCPYVP
jgi:hypothetical protein